MNLCNGRIALAAVLVALASNGCSSDGYPTGLPAPGERVVHYTVTFTSTWSAATHPQDFPGNAHFSPLVGATHHSGAVFWREGQLASPGIKAMAELGATQPLLDEVAAAVSAGTAQVALSGSGLSSPGSVALGFDVSDTHPLVTLVTMIAPSPDWFVGVRDLPLLVNGQWRDSLTVELKGWDAGTDQGSTYIAMNAPAMPPIPIFPLTDGPFVVNGQVPTLGRFTFRRE